VRADSAYLQEVDTNPYDSSNTVMDQTMLAAYTYNASDEETQSYTRFVL
jgi:hypothetical protein